MTSAFSWQNSVSLCFILYSKAKFACYSGCFLTSYFCSPVPYDDFCDTEWFALEQVSEAGISSQGSCVAGIWNAQAAALPGGVISVISQWFCDWLSSPFYKQEK